MSFLARASLVAGQTAGIAAVLMMILVTVSVLARYVLNEPFSFTEEISGYLVMFMVFMGLGYTFRTGGHIRTDLFTGRVSPGVRRWLDLFGALICLGWAAAVLWALAVRTLSYYQEGTQSLTPLQTLRWIPSVFMVIGTALLVLEVGSALLKLAASRSRHAGGGTP